MSERDDRRPAWVPLAALVVVVAGIVAVSMIAGHLPRRDDSGVAPSIPVARTSSTTAVTGFELAPGWEDVGHTAIPGSEWIDTGAELLFVNGGRGRSTIPQPYCGARCEWIGTAFDPAIGAVRTLPEPPMCAEGTPAGIWAGEELIVWSVTPLSSGCPVAAAYSPDSDRWRVLDSDFFRDLWQKPDFFGVEAGPQVVWTGQELISTAGLAYRPDTGETRSIPAADESPMFTDDTVWSTPEAHWTGSELLVLGSEGVIIVDPDSGDIVDGPSPPIPEYGRTSVWTGDGLLAVSIGIDMEAAMFDPTVDRWEEVDSVPLSTNCWGSDPAWSSGGHVAVLRGWCGELAVWDGSGEWKLLPSPTLNPWYWGGPLVAQDGYLYSLEGGFRYRLPELVDGKMPLPSFLPVGDQYLDVPSGWQATRVYKESAETVVVELVTPEGGTCRVESTYSRALYGPATTTTRVLTKEIEIDDQGLAHVVVWFQHGFVDVVCPNLDDAETAAARLRDIPY